MVDLPPYGLANMPVAEWDRVIDVNLRGPLLCTQAVLPSMDSAVVAGRNDDPFGRHDLLHRNAFPDGNNSAGFAECLPGCSDERVNRQGLIQQVRQDGLPAPHARLALPGPQWSSAGGGWKCVGLALRLADPRRRSVLWEVAAGA